MNISLLVFFTAVFLACPWMSRIPRANWMITAVNTGQVTGYILISGSEILTNFSLRTVGTTGYLCSPRALPQLIQNTPFSKFFTLLQPNTMWSVGADNQMVLLLVLQTVDKRVILMIRCHG